MTSILVPPDRRPFRPTLAALVTLSAWAIASAMDAASQSSNRPAEAGDGNCSVDIVIEATPRFDERLPCHYSNFPTFKSDRVSWTVPRVPGSGTVSLTTGMATTNWAEIRVPTVRIEYPVANGTKDVTPKANYLYVLDSTSRNTWTADVQVRPDTKVLDFIECTGGNFGSSLPPRAYLAGTELRLLWTTLEESHVVHGTLRAVLSCAKVTLPDSRKPLGPIGKLAIKF